MVNGLLQSVADEYHSEPVNTGVRRLQKLMCETLGLRCKDLRGAFTRIVQRTKKLAPHTPYIVNIFTLLVLKVGFYTLVIHF